MGHRRVDAQSSLRRRPTVRFAEVAVSGRAMLVSSILSLLLFNGGCSVIIAEVGWVDPSEIKEGSTRAAVQEKLGNPIRSERTREGARIDTYEYQKQPQDGHADIACDILTLGACEALNVPMAIYMRYTAPREQVTIYFDVSDHVLWVTPPLPSPADRRTWQR